MVDEGVSFSGNKSRLSQVRVNTKTFTIADFATILAEPKKPGKPYIPTSTGGGLEQDVPVFYSTLDNGQYIPFGNKSHYHTADNDSSGGLYYQLPVKNIGAYLLWIGQNFNVNQFYVETNGTGAAVTNDVNGTTGRIKVESGTSLDGYANIRIMSVPMSYAFDSSIIVRVEHSGALTNYLFRAGVAGERVIDSNDPTQRSYGIEACPADAKMLIWSADGSTRSTIPTVFDYDTSIHYWLLRHRPSLPKIFGNRDVDFTTGNTAEKTNNIPTSGSTPTRALFSAGMKSTVSSASKILYYRGAVIAGMPALDWRYFHPQYPETS